jgi:hypothetical protein
MSSSASLHDPKSHGLSPGAGGGIGAGAGVAALALIAVLVWWYRRRKDKKAWEMSGVPADMERFYIKRGTIQRQEDMNLGLQSTGMHDAREISEEEGMDVKSSQYHSSKSSGPSIPPRSPSRVI